mgnify:CR=1 FL=1
MLLVLLLLMMMIVVEEVVVVVMVTLDSVRVSILISIKAMAQTIAAERIKIGPKEISIKPGRRITSVPKNPIMIASQRRGPTFSPKNSIAKTVAKIGAVKLRAVNSAKGVIVTPVKKHSIDRPLMTPRMACNFGRLVASRRKPVVSSKGLSTRNPIRARKKATSKGGKESLTDLTAACMPTKAIPEIAKTAEHVTVFQRTPQYALPARNRPMTDAERSAYQADWQDHRMSMRRRGGWPFATSKLRANEATAAERQARYEEMWALGGMNLMINSYVGAIVDADLNNEISDFVRGKIRQTVKDAATAEKLMPDYHIGTKRIILDNGYFETYNRDNVSLVDLRRDPIESFAADRVSTQSQEIPLDMLVLATGYDAVSGSMLNLNPRGRNGLPLQQKWAERFDTHLGVSVAGFPNMFMIHGPGSPGVFFTMPLGAELQVQWVGQCIRHLDGNGHGTVETTPAAEQAWDAQIQAIANKTLYPKTNSWYLGANISGKPRQFLGHLAGSQYFDQLTATAEADFAGFVFEPAAGS